MWQVVREKQGYQRGVALWIIGIVAHLVVVEIHFFRYRVVVGIADRGVMM